MACTRCEIYPFIKDSCVDLNFLAETWLSAQGDKVKTVELAPSGFDMKSFPRQSRSRGGGIATISILLIYFIIIMYLFIKSILGSVITLKKKRKIITHRSK